MVRCFLTISECCGTQVWWLTRLCNAKWKMYCFYSFTKMSLNWVTPCDTLNHIRLSRNYIETFNFDTYISVIELCPAIWPKKFGSGFSVVGPCTRLNSTLVKACGLTRNAAWFFEVTVVCDLHLSLECLAGLLVLILYCYLRELIPYFSFPWYCLSGVQCAKATHNKAWHASAHLITKQTC